MFDDQISRNNNFNGCIDSIVALSIEMSIADY